MATTYGEIANKLSKKLGEYEETLKTSTEPTELESAGRMKKYILQALELLKISQQNHPEAESPEGQGMQQQMMPQQGMEQGMMPQQGGMPQGQPSPEEMAMMQQQQMPMPQQQGMSPYQQGGYLPQYQSSDATTPVDAQTGNLPGYKGGGGLSRKKDYGSKKKPYPSVSSGNFAGGGRSYPIPTRADAVDALRLAGLHGRSDVKSKVYAKYPGLKKKQEGGEIPWGEVSQGVLGAIGTAPIWRNMQQAGEPVTEYEPFINPYTGYLQENIGRMGDLAGQAEEAIKTDRAYDTRPELVKAKQRYGAAMQNAQNASGSARFALQNMASGRLAGETGDVLTKGQNIEQQWNDPRARGQALAGLGGLYGNMGRMGYGMGQDIGAERWKAFDWKERSEAARRGYGTQATMDLSEWAQTQQQMGSQKEMDQLSVKQQSYLADNFDWKKVNGEWTLVPKK